VTPHTEMAEFCPLYICTNWPDNTNVVSVQSHNFISLNAECNVELGHTFPSKVLKCRNSVSTANRVDVTISSFKQSPDPCYLGLSAKTSAITTTMTFGDAAVNIDVNDFFYQSHSPCPSLETCEIKQKASGVCGLSIPSWLS
jgi:hypothetical protein